MRSERGNRDRRPHLDRPRSQGRRKIIDIPFVQVAHDDKRHHAERYKSQLVAGAQKRGQEGQVSGGPKHVAVHLLPSILVAEVALLIGDIQRRA